MCLSVCWRMSVFLTFDIAVCPSVCLSFFSPLIYLFISKTFIFYFFYFYSYSSTYSYSLLFFIFSVILQARRKVTHKNALDDVSEQTGVAIISRGAYVPPGKKLEPGERRLFLLLEGNTDLQVRQAKLEILRLLDEETMRLGAAGNASSFGRYAVL